MAAKKKSLIRQQIRDRILTIGYTESYTHWESIGRSGQNVADKKFAIGFSATNENGGRQRPLEGIDSLSDCTVIALMKINPHNQVQTYDAALDGEEAIISVVTNHSLPLYNDISIRYINSSQTLTDKNEFIIITIQFAISHYIPLQ